MSSLWDAFQGFCSQPKNYNAGWDVPIECWTEEELKEQVAREGLSYDVLCTLPQDLALKLIVKKLRPLMELLQERREEIQAEIF